VFGIGFGEFLIIALVILFAVGPGKMPTFMKAVGKGVREFRRATRELRSASGIDELMRDEDLRELRELREVRKGLAEPARTAPPAPLDDDERASEAPPEGTDVTWARERARADDEPKTGAS
jgi:TatA/E family protein of Tat protein translocase